MPTWTGAGADNNWSTAANWDTGVPTAGTTAVFNGVAANGNKNCTITAGATCVSINTTGYTGQLNFANNLTVSGSVTWGAGTTFTGASTLTINGTSTYTSNGVTFPNTLITSGTITLGDNSTIKNLTSSGSTTFNSNNLYITGNLTVNNSIAGTTTLNLTGTGTWSSSSYTSYNIANNIIINTSGTITISNGVAKGGTSSSMTYTAGTLAFTGATPKIAFFGSVSLTSGALTTWGVIEPQATLTLVDDCTVDTVTTVVSGNITVNGNTMYVKNSILVGYYNFAGTTNYILNGTGTFSGFGGVITTNITINTSGTITLSGSINFQTKTLTYTAGTIVDSSSTLTLNSCTWVSNGTSWGNVNLSGGGITMTGNSTVKNLSQTGLGSTLNSTSTIYVTGNLSHPSYNLAGTATIELTGSNNITWSGSGNLSNNLIINKIGTITLSGNISYGGASSTLTYTASGGITPGTITFTSVAGTTYNINSSGFTLYNFSPLTGTHTINTGTITVNNNLRFNGNTTFAGSGGWTVNDLTDSTAGRILTLKDGSTYTVTGNLALTGTNASPFVVQSSSATLRAILTLNQGANQTVQFVRATRIDSGAGQTIWDTVGTIVNPLTDTINWNSGAKPAPNNKISMA